MLKLFSLAVVPFFLSSIFVAESNDKCDDLLNKGHNIMKCCKVPFLVDQMTIAEASKQQVNTPKDFCVALKTIMEKLGVTNFDKAVYHGYLGKTVQETDWIPVFEKNLEFCMNLAPKIAELVIKKINETITSCDVRFPVTLGCLYVKGISECPAKFFTDNTECKDVKNTVTDCFKVAEEIVKMVETKLNFLPI